MPVFPFTSPRQSVERLAVNELDKMIKTCKQMGARLDAALSIVDVAASGSLALTVPAVLTAVTLGEEQNGNKVRLQVNEAAANPTDTVLVEFKCTSGVDQSDITIIVTPNDGTNNPGEGPVPVPLTGEELVELINTGAVVSVDVTLIDPLNLRALYTATGGDDTELANAGEGDGELATMASGITSLTTMFNRIADLRHAVGAQDDDFIKV